MNDMEEIDLYGKPIFQPCETYVLTQSEVLGISSSASKSEIKKAYHKVYPSPASPMLCR